MKYIKTIFFIFNFILLTLYLYPGSMLGCVIYDNCLTQPQIVKDIVISSNHFIVFLFFSILGIFSYSNKIRNICIYLLCCAFFLEILHYFIPNRTFQIQDLFGNILGAIIPLVIVYFVKYRRKKV